MAWALDKPLITVSCHEDLTASDLIGRYIFVGDETVWEDGPLTLAVRYGGICYLDEVVEARNDTTVVIHSLTDDRRMLYIDKRQEVVRAHPDFMMIMSYNPGYQNVMKDLKQSTRQRFMSLIFDHPDIETETRIVTSESGVDNSIAKMLAAMGEKIRNLKGYGLTEGVSSRLLVYAGRLIKAGVEPVEAARIAIAQSLTDDPGMIQSVMDIINLFFGPMKTNEELLKHGFDLKSVTWGYRDKFLDFIDQLYDDKLLGDDNREATDAFFTMMSQAGSNNIFDHVLIKFLEALSPETNWIMRIPSLFSDWCSLGADFAQSNIGYGMKYFEIWNKSGFGQTPEEVSYTIDKARFLNSLNMKLSLTFLETYEKLHRHLDFRGIDIFIESAMKIHHRNKKKAIEFLSLKTKTSKHYLKMISCEARLDDVRSRLKLLVTSICGRNIDIQDLSQLDSDDLILRGSTVVAFNNSFHFPGKASLYETAAENRDWYMFAAAINAGAIFFKSFRRFTVRPGRKRHVLYRDR